MNNSESFKPSSASFAWQVFISWMSEPINALIPISSKAFAIENGKKYASTKQVVPKRIASVAPW